MKIISISELVRCDGIDLYPLVRYVLPDDVGRSIIQLALEKKIGYTISSFNSFERRYAGQPSGRLAFFRHTAWGDQLMATAVVNAIQQLRPDLRLDVYCSPKVINMWEGVARAFPFPMVFDGIKSYNYHAFYEGMLENNGEPDQENAIDDMLAFVGIAPSEVPDALKVPCVHTHKNDYAELTALDMKWVKDSDYVLIQLQASNPNRNYPYVQTLHLCTLILETLGLSVILVGQEKEEQKLKGFSQLSDRYGKKFISLVNKLDHFRSHIPLVQFAKAVICPDSSIGHLAAAFPYVPTISLWGLFDPNDRVKYYKNHHPLVGFEACPHAPCRKHEFILPQVKCKDATNASLGTQLYCNALKSIPVSKIMDTLESVLNDEDSLSVGA